jgi:hypothetical protein
MPIRDFDTASGIAGRNIRDAFLSSTSCAVTSIEATRAYAATDVVKSLSKREVA